MPGPAVANIVGMCRGACLVHPREDAAWSLENGRLFTRKLYGIPSAEGAEMSGGWKSACCVLRSSAGGRNTNTYAVLPSGLVTVHSSSVAGTCAYTHPQEEWVECERL